MTMYDILMKKPSRRPTLVREIEIDYEATKRMCSPDRIVDLMKKCYRMDEKADEYVYMLTMNTKCDLTGVFLIGKGNTRVSAASTREIFIRALLAGATGIVLVHNHPSGDPSPSKEDLELTKRVATIGRLLEIAVLDHIIIGDRWWSMKSSCPDLLQGDEGVDKLR